MNDDFDIGICDGKNTLIKYHGHEQTIIIPTDVDIIGIEAFKNCSIVNIEIPGNVYEIGTGAFSECRSLSSVILHEGVRVIDQLTFEGCSSLSSVKIPKSLTMIGDLAFRKCENLPFIVIPKGIKYIGDNAFQWCLRLEFGIYYHHKPTDRDYIQSFRNQYIYLLDEKDQRIGKLYYLYESDNPEDEFVSRLIRGIVKHLSEYDAIFSAVDDIVIRKVRAALCRLEYPLELNEEYKKLYLAYLQNNAALIIPYLIKTGELALISGLARVGAISDANIGDYIEIANKLSQTEILVTLLDYKNIIIQQESPLIMELDINNHANDWETHVNPDGTLTIIKYRGKRPDVTIPSTINGRKVKSLKDWIGSLIVSIFFPHKNLVQLVIIEEGVEEIGERAFLECTNLKSVEIPSSVAMIGKEAFYGCKSLTSVVIQGGVKNIGEAAFDECLDLVIHSPKGSYAIKYAKENGIKFVET